MNRRYVVVLAALVGVLLGLGVEKKNRARLCCERRYLGAVRFKAGYS